VESKTRMKLVDYTDPVLTTSCEDFNFTEPPFDPIEFSHNLIKYMYDVNAIGLAANQVGVPFRIFSMRGSPENFVCYNPRIVSVSPDQETILEACVTYPGLFVPIKRPIHVRFRFTTPNGQTQTNQYTGATARVIQHEMMHLNGKVFFEGMVSRLTLERSIKKAAKAGHDYRGVGLMRAIK
jgi:peptide deformylase